MWAIRPRLAGNAAIDTRIVLTREARDAVVGVVATRIDAQTASNDLVALVGRVAAIGVVFASAASCDKTTREIIATRGKADFTHGTGRVGVAQRIRVWTRRAERARGAPRATASAPGATNSAGAAASCHAPRATESARAAIDASVRIDGGVAPTRRRDSGFTTARHGGSGQQNVSKEAHGLVGNPPNEHRSLGLSRMR